MPLIEFESVSKRYRLGSRRGVRDAVPDLLRRLIGRKDGRCAANEFIWALKDVSFEVEPGETLGVIGRNGAGKTTILKLLSHITKPTEGSVRVSGRTSALIELGAGFHPDLTGRENIYLNASILGLKKREVDGLLDDIIAFAELEPFIDTPVKRYSSGMYARLGFSVAAHVDPDVLLVDEVLSVGDILFQQKCLNRIRDFQNAGKSIVFVSHNLVSVQKVCSRVIWLDKGRIKNEGDPQQVVNDYVYQQMQEKAGASGFRPGEIPLRYGTGEAEIRRVLMRSEDGEERDVFECGESVRVEIEYRASRRITPINFFAIVTDDQGIKLCGTDFRKTGFDGLEYIEGEGRVHCCLRSVPLRPGAYFLIIGIEGEGRIMDRKGMIGPFTIRPNLEEGFLPPGRYGLFDVGSYWAVDRACAEVRG